MSATTTTSATGAVDDSEWWSYSDAAFAEIQEWEATLPVVDGARQYPDPEEPDGLPIWWTFRSRMVEMGSRRGASMVLAECATGGWVLLWHSSYEQTTRMQMGAKSLWALLERCRDLNRKRTVAWLEQVVAGMYDLTDPLEVAEQMLVALTGRVTVPPRAAL